jgi:hypothetical protein
MKMDSSVLGQSLSVNVTFDGEVSSGNQWGTIETAGISQEMRLVNGEVFSRTLPNGKWSQSAAMPAYLVICPLFGVTNKDIQLVGQEMKDGQLLNHLQSTGSWNPDISRMALADLSSLNVRPDVKVLDLWAKPDGTPVSATFSGTNTAANGTKLVDIEVTYTFSQVGFPQTIDVPSNSPIPSPTK